MINSSRISDRAERANRDSIDQVSADVLESHSNSKNALNPLSVRGEPSAGIIASEPFKDVFVLSVADCEGLLTSIADDKRKTV